MSMSTTLAPPSPGGGGAFTLAAWNIRCGRNAGLTSAAKGLAQMGVGFVVASILPLGQYTCIVRVAKC